MVKVWFNNFDRTTGFYWSYTLLPKLTILMDSCSHFACAIRTSLGVNWKHFSFWRKAIQSVCLPKAQLREGVVYYAELFIGEKRHWDLIFFFFFSPNDISWRWRMRRTTWLGLCNVHIWQSWVKKQVLNAANGWWLREKENKEVSPPQQHRKQENKSSREESTFGELGIRLAIHIL